MNLKTIQTRKEWIINGVLLAAIVALVVLIGAESFSPPENKPASPVAVSQRTPAAPAPTAETTYGPEGSAKRSLAARSESFANLDRHNVFREMITPPPTPTKAPATPTPTPDLADAVKEWKFSYFWRSRNVFVFQSKGGKQLEIQAGKPYTVEAGRQKLDVTVEPGTGPRGKYEALIRYGDQAVTKSMLE